MSAPYASSSSTESTETPSSSPGLPPVPWSSWESGGLRLFNTQTVETEDPDKVHRVGLATVTYHQPQIDPEVRDVTDPPAVYVNSGARDPVSDSFRSSSWTVHGSDAVCTTVGSVAADLHITIVAAPTAALTPSLPGPTAPTASMTSSSSGPAADFSQSAAVASSVSPAATDVTSSDAAKPTAMPVAPMTSVTATSRAPLAAEQVVPVTSSYATARAPSALRYFDAMLHGVPVRLLVDLGASVSLVNRSVYDEIRSSTRLLEADIALRAYGGATIPCLGHVVVPVHVGNRRITDFRFYVTTDGPSVLSIDLFDALGGTACLAGIDLAAPLASLPLTSSPPSGVIRAISDRAPPDQLADAEPRRVLHTRMDGWPPPTSSQSSSTARAPEHARPPEHFLCPGGRGNVVLPLYSPSDSSADAIL